VNDASRNFCCCCCCCCCCCGGSGTNLPFHASVDTPLEIRIIVGAHPGHLFGVIVVVAIVALRHKHLRSSRAIMSIQLDIANWQAAGADLNAIGRDAENHAVG
jgi:hypothetical protein